MTHIIIRDSIPNDIPAINEVAHLTWLATYPSKEADITVEDVESVYREDDPEKAKVKLERRKARYNNPNFHVWVAEDDGKIIGFCHAVKEEKSNRIMAIYVLPKYHGTGTGKSLIQLAFNWLGNEKDILVNVVKYNDHAIGFYEHMGFVKTDNEGIFDDIARLPTGKAIPEIQMRLIIKKKIMSNL
ncbi:MAG: GNAT family acetyltransferase [Candidatus Amesbacteria bacterium GW2011_GWA2_42_12]|uniref:GNAT family acetyltransferase n=1 Tax=Candidatus Amesbacteria bacterium GW2011_GWA2_42_12 TaxID=1618356 RepID=A0A0G0Y2Z7_9BACT|nr:MAG: GNAT family acetyltransferase [Candidatus Amesbacteria bacterium GW2011_GWA2_42_12]